MVEKKIIVEKAIKALNDIHLAQILTHLKTKTADWVY